jgi:hypothetical protein
MAESGDQRRVNALVQYLRMLENGLFAYSFISLTIDDSNNGVVPFGKAVGFANAFCRDAFIFRDFAGSNNLVVFGSRRNVLLIG